MTRSSLPPARLVTAIRLLAIIVTFAGAMGAIGLSPHHARPPIAPAAFVPPAPPAPGEPTLLWERRWPAVAFRESSPVAANLGRSAVVVGALDGNLYGLDATTGADLAGWPVRTGKPINSSPAAADLAGTGRDSIVVGTGTADHGECSGGSVLVVDAPGTVRWQRAGTDRVCASQAFHSSPSIGDTTGSGQPSITIGALGLRSWSWSAAGVLNPGWPFFTDDTVFATAALADLHGNGVTDIVMGGDSSPGGQIDFRGGLVRAVRGDGRLLWQYRTNEIVRSSPAVGELIPGAGPAVVFGTGNYWVNQPGGASDADKVFALDRSGHLRWSRDLGGQTIGGPALADVLGTGRLDVVIGTADGPQGGRIWVLDGTGKPLPHWAGAPTGGGVVIGGITTADLSGEGGQDLLVPTGAGVFAYNGRTGLRLFALDDHEVGFQSSPLVTREAEGLAVTVAGTTADGIGVVQRWLLPATSGAKLGDRGWPTFHHDSRRTGNVDPPPLAARRCAGAGINGYWEAGSDGGVFGWCGAGFHGSPVGTPLAAPVVAMASSASGQGYWEAAADGGVFSFGDAPFVGSARGQPLRSPIVGMARTPTGAGYWLASADGGVFSFGDAPFFGGAGGVRLPFRVVAILGTPSGQGYWLIGNEGTVLTYGDARFFGSLGPVGLHAPIVGGAATPSGLGYWLVAADGGLFTYGDAQFLGSAGGLPLTQPIVAMAATAAGRGYWLIGADGGVFSFGDAPFVGSAAGTRLNGPIAAVSAPAA
ncbi:MAG: hypothetical protein NVSMB12_12660 [Acidimicrobiales bacterium]